MKYYIVTIKDIDNNEEDIMVKLPEGYICDVESIKVATDITKKFEVLNVCEITRDGYETLMDII